VNLQFGGRLIFEYGMHTSAACKSILLQRESVNSPRARLPVFRAGLQDSRMNRKNGG
jgi:hypothetical protein